jgi:hypothetical protein
LAGEGRPTSVTFLHRDARRPGACLIFLTDREGRAVSQPSLGEPGTPRLEGADPIRPPQTALERGPKPGHSGPAPSAAARRDGSSEPRADTAIPRATSRDRPSPPTLPARPSSAADVAEVVAGVRAWWAQDEARLRRIKFHLRAAVSALGGAMATRDEASQTGKGVGPQTPAARRRARSAFRQDRGDEPTELEGWPAAGAKIDWQAAPQSVSVPGSGPVAPRDSRPASEVRPAPTTRHGRAALGSPASRPTPRPASRRGAAPASTRERAAAFLALGSAVGVLLSLVVSLAPSDRPMVGEGDFGATASRPVAGSGGLIALVGSDAPDRTPLVLETRAHGGDWREAGRTSADEDGDFRLEGRLQARPGQLTVRARAPGVATSAPSP